MKKRSVKYILIFIILFIVFSCDNYDLMEQFNTNMNLVLNPEKTTIQQGATIDLNPSGGVAPYSFIILEGDVYYSDPDGSASVADNRYTADNTIGEIIIRLTDSKNNSVETVITTIPPSPTNFEVTKLSLTKVDVSWNYSNTSFISGFRIMRADGSSAYEPIDINDPGITNYEDTISNPTHTYYYYMYAVSDAYVSSSTQTRMIRTNP